MRLRVLIVTACLLIGASPAFAQPPPNELRQAVEAGQSPAPPATATNGLPTAAEALTEAVVEERRTQAAESTELDEETKKKVADWYTQAAEQLQRSRELAAKAAAFANDAENVTARVDEIRRQLKALETQEPARFIPGPPPVIRQSEAESQGQPAGAPRELKRELAVAEYEQTQLQQELAKRQSRLRELKESQDKLEGSPASRANRRKEIREQLATVSERLATVQRQLQAAPPADEQPLVTLARNTELQARRMALEQETPAGQAELAKYDAEDAADLLRLERDLIAQEVARSTKEVESVESQLQAKRVAVGNLAAQLAEEEAVHAQPLLRPYAEENAQLAREVQTLAPLIAQTEARRKSAGQELDSLKRRFEQTRARVESVGLSHSIGAMLRKERADLPDVQGRKASVRDRQETIDDAQLALFRYDDQRSELANIEPLIERIVSTATGAAIEEERLAKSAEHVLMRQREYLDSVRGSYNTYFDSLVELSSVEQRIIRLAEDYGKYIDDRVLWVRSNRPLYQRPGLDDSDLSVLRADFWLSAGRRLAADAQANLVLYVAVALLLVVMLRSRSRMRRELAQIAQQVRRGSFMQFAPTLRAALLTVLISVPVPALLLFLGWRLSKSPENAVAARVVGIAVLSVFRVLLPIELLRNLCRRDGLAEAHFEWPESALQLLKRQLRLLLLLGLPLVFAITLLYFNDTIHGVDSLERVLFCVGSIVIAVFLWRILSAKGGVFQEYIAHHRGGWLDRLRHVWCWLCVTLPLLLGGLTILGYYYTALQLSWRLLVTAWIIVGFVVLRAMLFRWLLVSRRRISLAQLRERRANAAAETSTTSLSPQQLAPQEEPLSDLRAQTEQSRRLVSAAILVAVLASVWAVWGEVTSALSFLDRRPLWTTTVRVQETIPSAIGSEPQTVSRELTKNITAVNVAFAMLIGVFTFVAARNIPGLTEISILQRLPLDSSVRYAITTLVSYAIAIIGLLLASRSLGLRWEQVQWLATALTFGLAFGLQEMFANFVAGIILLFERPIRVGDVVTVDNNTGVVSRMRIRATTITNWDRKELIVPNKEFITGRLLNWTLSDAVNRVVINIGIAYGSNTEQARELLLRVADEHPLLLKEPPPAATFEGFGDNSLNFYLRVYLPNMDNRLTVIHELHTAIDRAFRDAEIEISFPQRDLHIRSWPNAPPFSQNGQGGERSSSGAKRDQTA